MMDGVVDFEKLLVKDGKSAFFSSLIDASVPLALAFSFVLVSPFSVAGVVVGVGICVGFSLLSEYFEPDESVGGIYFDQPMGMDQLMFITERGSYMMFQEVSANDFKFDKNYFDAINANLFGGDMKFVRESSAGGFDAVAYEYNGTLYFQFIGSQESYDDFIIADAVDHLMGARYGIVPGQYSMALDFVNTTLEEQPGYDHTNIVLLGHSLGGGMSDYVSGETGYNSFTSDPSFQVVLGTGKPSDSIQVTQNNSSLNDVVEGLTPIADYENGSHNFVCPETESFNLVEQHYVVTDTQTPPEPITSVENELPTYNPEDVTNHVNDVFAQYQSDECINDLQNSISQSLNSSK